ncbi:MAG: hypothetical protein LBH57_01900, partial [Treponema sp.]|nr:hypothetical protein [Treponema sp.]
MKTVKLTGFLSVGILALLLAGCFNPISVVPLGTVDNPLAEPFSVDIMIGPDTVARSVAGPD